MRKKKLQIHLTGIEFAMVLDAAKKADVTTSDFGRKTLLKAAANDRKPDDSEVLIELRSFRRLFSEAMELNLDRKLTPARFKAMVARRSE